jgi:hypothetical protein
MFMNDMSWIVCILSSNLYRFLSMLPCLCVMDCRCSIWKGVQLAARVHAYKWGTSLLIFLLLSWIRSCAWICSNWPKYLSEIKHFSFVGFFSIFVLPHQRCKLLDKCELDFFSCSRLWGVVGENPEYYLEGFTDCGSLILFLQCLHKWSVPIISVVYKHILPPIGAEVNNHFVSDLRCLHMHNMACF